MKKENIISSKVPRANLKDLVDEISSVDEQQRTIALLERGHEIKKLLGSERDKKTGKPAKGDKEYGLLAELADIKEELSMVQVSNDLQGLRHGRIGSSSLQMPGKEYLSITLLMDAGVTPEQIQQGTLQGDSYYQTTLFELKP